MISLTLRAVGRLCLRDSWKQVWGSFRISGDADGTISCQVPVSAGLLMVCGRDRLESGYRALLESI